MKCPVCNNNAQFLYILPKSFYKDYSEELNKIFFCESCNLEFKSLIYYPQKVKDYYKSLDDTYYDTLNKKRDDLIFFKNKVLHYKKSGLILDIGAGKGEFLSMLPGDCFKKYGVEPAPVKNVGDFFIYNDFIENVCFEDLKFDVITSFDLVEHLTEINAFAALIGRITVNGSIVIITTPNISSFTRKMFGRFWRHYLPFGHIILFSSDSLEKIFKREGFELLSCENYDHRIDIKKSLIKFAKSLILFPFKYLVNKTKILNTKPLYVDMYKDYNIYVFKKS